jgi:hypothetical protein
MAPEEAVGPAEEAVEPNGQLVIHWLWCSSSSRDDPRWRHVHTRCPGQQTQRMLPGRHRHC